MIKKTIVLMLWVLVLIPVMISAEGQGNNLSMPQFDAGLSLEQSIEIALANNRQMLIAQEGMNYADARLSEASARKYPTLSSTASYTRLDEVATVSIGPGVSGTMGDVNNAKGELSIKQPIYSGGRISAGVESALLGKTVQSNQKDDITTRVIFLVKKVYYDVLLNEAIVEVNRKSESVSRAHLENIRKLFEQGQSSRYELLRAQVQLTNIQAMRIQSETNIQNVKLVFMNTIGLPLEKSEALKLTGKLNLPAGGDGVRDVLEHSAKLEEAFHNRADLKIAQLKIDMQKQSIVLAESEGKPAFNLIGNFGYEYPSRKKFLTQAWGDYWSVVTAASIPVFEWGRIKARIRQEESLLKQAEIAEMDIRERIKLEVRQSVSSVKDSVVLIETQTENIKQAEEGLRLAEIGYKNGVNTQLEVLDTQMALDTASKNYVQSLYQYNLAKANLDLVTGK
ncbi:MAG: TolC family protein [Planctomycetes bacterium]|nr:TolC family protein [Planctomycetota bacterium]